jgi:hypothetical protein
MLLGASTAAATSGAFADSFDDGVLDGWSVVHTDWAIEAGALRGFGASGQTEATIYKSDVSASRPLRVEFDIAFTKGAQGHAGMMLSTNGQVPRPALSGWTVDWNGDASVFLYRIIRWDNPGLITSTFPGPPPVAGVFQHWSIVVLADGIELTVDGIPVGSVSDGTHAGPFSFGFWTFVGNQVRFDNVALQPGLQQGITVQVPGAGFEQGFPSLASPPVGERAVTTPPIQIPATCSQPPCEESVPLVVPATTVPRTCAVVVCAGPVTIPERPIGTLPPVCSFAEAACIPGQTIPGQTLVTTPGVPSMPLAPASSVSVQVDPTWVGLSGPGELASVGPLQIDIPAPLVGSVPITVCPTGCPAPASPVVVEGRVTIDAAVGDQGLHAAVPVGPPG